MRARVCLFAVVVLFVCTCAAQELAHRMSNKDVIDMTGLGLGDDVIITKIRSSAGDATFDTSVDALKALKEAKVSDAVIRAMINPQVPAVAAAPQPAVPADDPNLPPKEVGVYWKDGSNFVFIEGQTVSNAKIGGRAAHYFSYGIASKKWNAEIPGAESNNKVKDRQPLFYFYAPENSGPADLVLVKLDKKSDHRQWEIGRIGGWAGGHSGTKDEDRQGFRYDRVAPRTYKLTLLRDLEPGEYGLFLETGSSIAGTGHDQVSGAAQGRIFDFSIPK